ncbi:uncharacterized protein EAE98_002474 [Botrytis deweyae]|uniref:glutathione transferase n=1 Tax=Botrytis deweyae TaxID=2478750 RepID=A0ABQ7IX97_9HELO|nr:uncharacterized protein EAE98_002474 [Botrytis deweyae]KAF7936255.1 hypothetical protein EAE98_002474 [Botrytis deweyae]
MAEEETPTHVKSSISPGKVTLYVVPATPTSGAHVVKILILMELLSIPHVVKVVLSPSDDEWFWEINPYRMVPAIESEDLVEQPEKKPKLLNVFESCSCLAFLAFTDDCSATGNWWLVLKRKHGDSMREAIEIFADAIKKEYSILENRLQITEQNYIALSDRLTIADIAILPFANENIAASAGIDFSEYPSLQAWSRKLLGLPQIIASFELVTTFGR